MNHSEVGLTITRHNSHSDRLSSFSCIAMLWTPGNYINDGLIKEKPKPGGVPEYFGRGVDRRWMLNYSAAVDYSKIITIEPGKRSGKPCIRGLRITVQDVFEYLAGGAEDQILEDFLSLPGTTLMLASLLLPTASGSYSWHRREAAIG